METGMAGLVLLQTNPATKFINNKIVINSAENSEQTSKTMIIHLELIIIIPNH
jgi:hypothetical protein